MVEHRHSLAIAEAAGIGPDLVATEIVDLGLPDTEALVIVVRLVETEIEVSMENPGHPAGILENIVGDEVCNSGVGRDC